MNIVIFPDATPQEREEALKAKAVKTESRTYSRTLSTQEISVEKHRYAQDAIELDSVKEKAKQAANDFKAQIKAKEDKMAETLAKIKNQKAEQTGFLYGIVNHEEKLMVFYDKYGEMINSRELLPDEMQGHLFADSKAGKTALPLPDGGKTELSGTTANPAANNASTGTKTGQENKTERPEGMADDEWTAFEAQKQKEFAAKAQSDGKATATKQTAATSTATATSTSIDKPGVETAPTKTQAQVQKENADKNLNKKNQPTPAANAIDKAKTNQPLKK